MRSEAKSCRAPYPCRHSAVGKGLLLLVAALAGLVAIVFISLGRERLKQVNLMPDKAIANVKEKVQWANNQIK